MRIRFVGRPCETEGAFCDAFGFRWPRGQWLGAPKLSPQALALIKANPAFETDEGKAEARPQAASMERPAPPPEKRETGWFPDEPDAVG